jgi:hypothetical protein
MCRNLVGSLVALLLMTSSVFAADDNTTATVTPAIAGPTTSLVPLELSAPIDIAPRIAAPRRPLALPFLYAGSVVLQGYDAYATVTVLKHGGTEANPLLKGIKSPIAVVGLRAGVTMVSIIEAERMWKHDQRLRAVLTMVAFNGVMAIVAAHNTAVIQSLK